MYFKTAGRGKFTLKFRKQSCSATSTLQQYFDHFLSFVKDEKENEKEEEENKRKKGERQEKGKNGGRREKREG